MKRIPVVVSKKDDLATDPNFQSIHNYFELGWEMGASRIDCLQLFATNQITPELHEVVTLRDRQFLYSKLLPTVAWEDWSKERGITDASRLPSDIIDLTNFYANTAGVRWEIYHGGHLGHYIFEDQVRNWYDWFDAPPVNGEAKEPYFLCCWRYRNQHHRERNTPDATARSIHEFLLKRAAKVYVVGIGSEPLCDGQRIVHVSLPMFCALCVQPNCRGVIGAMTGTMQFAAIACRSRIAAYQHNPQEPVNTMDHPVVLGECVNFHRNKRLIRYEPVTPIHQFLQELNLFLS